MIQSTKTRFLCAVVALLAGLSVPQLSAQNDIEIAWSNSLTAMRAGKWAEAHGILAQACATFDGRAPDIFGPKFGWFWYHKGYAELKLKQWEEAMKSFEVCYKKYSNKDANRAQAGDNPNVSFNHYHKKALLKWGDAALGAQEWETAIRMYKKFLAERDSTAQSDQYERGAFHINMAVCHFKLMQLPGGIEQLEIAIRNKESFPTPDEGIMVGFRALVEGVIEKRNEQAFLDFIGKNRADIKLATFQMHKFAQIFMMLAADALEAEMHRAAFELYALVPSTQAAIDDIQARLAQVGSIGRPFDDPPQSNRVIDKAQLEADLEALKKQLSSGDPHEVIATAATAYIHEKAGNVRGAFAAYERLEQYYNKSKEREKYLYNLVRTSALITEVLTTERYGSLFLQTFPNSEERVRLVRSMMLTSLFHEGEYEKCIEVATVMLPKLPKPSDQHDICLHVLGGSYFYTGQYDDARPLLDEHVETYEESQFRMAALYFQASNLSKLQYWSAAADLLDKFLSKYPDPRENIYMPYALYDRANCHYAEEELDPALVKLNRVENEFPGADIMEMAYNLKGNVLQTQGDYQQAEEYYLKALELAERKENRLVAGESLYYLVAMLGAEKRDKEPNPRVKDAVPFYDKFWDEHGSDSPYKAQVAVAGIHALAAVDRAEEALERLQGVIAELASVQGAFGLEEAINSYTRAYLDLHEDPEKLKEHYYDFEGINAENREAQALLRIALITVFEEKLKKASEDDNNKERIDADAMIKVLFADLQNDFQPAQLTNYVLVRLGDYLREKTTAPRQALPYYKEVVGRTDQSYRFPAHFGIADIYGRPDATDAEKQEALTSLKHVVENAPEKRQKEAGLYRIVEILADKGDWKEVSTRAKEYLTTDGYSRFAGYVQLLLAQSYERRAMREDAIAAYATAFGAYTGLVAVSAPAVYSLMNLSWTRNQRDDRQKAYDIGHQYISTTNHLYVQMTDEEKTLWDQVKALVQQYGATTGIQKAPEAAETR